MVATLVELFGPASYDETTAYSETDDFGGYHDPVSDQSFIAPVGRTVCWLNAFCGHFGGELPAALTFVGWTQGPEPDQPPLATPDGITVGSSVADHVDAIEVPEAGCYSQSYGSAHGITVSLWSAGVPFTEFSDDGTVINQAPPPGDLTVTFLQAGDAPYYAFMDC